MISGMTDSITQLAAAKESNTSTPLVTAAEDPETTAALLQADNMFLTGHEAIEVDILAQIDIKSVDPVTYSRHREKFSDIRSFTENAIKEDPSIETDFKAALKKTGTERAAALRTLKGRLGPSSHRQQIVGDAMLFHLITRPSTSAAVKKSAATASRDFLFQGHYEPTQFINRCQEGQTLLLCDTTAAQRNTDMQKGLTAVRQHSSFEVLVMGIILKLGYTSKPSSDLQVLLDDFKTLRQHQNEQAHDWNNRFSVHVVSLQNTTDLLQKSGYMPSEGEKITQYKKGTKKDLREKANAILQTVWHMPLHCSSEGRGDAGRNSR